MKIAIDCGHGSNTSGKRTPPFTKSVDVNQDGVMDVKKREQYREHYANVGVAVELNQELSRLGFETVKVSWDDEDGTNDVNVPLTTRQKQIKNAGCDLSISIHFNAYGDGTEFNDSQGIGTFIHSDDTKVGDSEKLATIVQNYLFKGTLQKNRGVKKQNLAMCNTKAMNTKASILVELAFMTNEREAQDLMANQQFWKECAKEISQGICEYANVTYVEDTIVHKKTNPYPVPKTTVYYRRFRIMSGNSVRWVQWELLDAGFHIVTINGSKKNLILDGKCGPITNVAIRNYQKKYKLKVDGKVGLATRTSMIND